MLAVLSRRLLRRVAVARRPPIIQAAALRGARFIAPLTSIGRVVRAILVQHVAVVRAPLPAVSLSLSSALCLMADLCHVDAV
jgi:hypothetical protein